MNKKRLTIENRMLIEQLLKLNYSLKDIADAVDSTSATVSTGNINFNTETDLGVIIMDH